MAATGRLSRKRIMITGAARGIGAGVARKLAQQGARVALVGIEPDLLEQVSGDCGADSIFLEADVSDRSQIESATAEVAEQLGGIDALFANAGIATAGSVRTIDQDAFDRTIEVNLLGVWRTVRAALPHIIDSKGYILTNASASALAAPPLIAAYAASKAGAEAFSNSLRVEVAHLGVDVGVAYFLWIDTDMVRDSDEIPPFAKFRAQLRGPVGKTLPLERAVDAVVDGIERRKKHVYAPGSVALLHRLRGFRSLFDRDAYKLAPAIISEVEARAEELGAAEASSSARTREHDPALS